MWFVTLFLGFLIVLYLWTKKKYSYFRSKGIAEEPGDFKWYLRTFVCLYIANILIFSHSHKIKFNICLGYFPLGSNFSWKMLTGRMALVQITDDAYNNFPSEKVTRHIL